MGRRGCPPTDRLDGEVSADAVAALADDLDAPDRVQVLVIDDFHLAGPSSADTPRWLVEYHMPSLQLVVASRVDPPLRVHRMRGTPGSGRTAGRDLAFSVEETRSLLAGFGVLLDEPELALVHRRSEGSVAGFKWLRSRSRVRLITPPRLAAASGNRSLSQSLAATTNT